MIITNSTTDTTGTARTNVYFWVKYDVSTLNVDGIIKGEIMAFVSEAAMDAEAARIFLIKDGQQVNNISFVLAATDVVKSAANCLVSDVADFWNDNAKTALEALTGWTVTN